MTADGDERSWEDFVDKWSPFAHVPYPECGLGWYDLIDELVECLVIEIKERPFYIDEEKKNPFRLFSNQIKEKYGTLCFYISHGNDRMYDLIEEAQRLSAKICETCGESGRLTRQGMWLETRCEKCQAPDAVPMQSSEG